ncbi:hypothetical protein BHAMNSH16_08490 [Brachyspira hampsonii]|uniref:Uncharacterized protein n=1 Tax=Brachyspira hampsonii TaxID=1287055 RepID=A0AAC9XKV0_9SPIR|nr:hypothetical protein BHAMNSH16_08490 [Brachyspira hampsonii]ELV05714.1 hypothetical protein H263_08549 [Brachyspira hampsonii 30599]OEJ12932.1 hypothetical protein A9496_03065 [Brachyspira hampsonii]
MIINPLRSPIELAVFKLNVKRKIIRDKIFLKKLSAKFSKMTDKQNQNKIFKYQKNKYKIEECIAEVKKEIVRREEQLNLLNAVQFVTWF